MHLPDWAHPSEVLYWLVIFMSSTANFVAYTFIRARFDEFEKDMINTVDVCAKINEWYWPNVAIHAFTSLMMLFCGQYLSFVIHFGFLIYYHLQDYHKGRHMLDPQEIYQPYVLRKERKLRDFHFIFYGFVVFYTVFRIIAVIGYIIYASHALHALLGGMKHLNFIPHFHPR